jgi:hypothetical protein
MDSSSSVASTTGVPAVKHIASPHLPPEHIDGASTSRPRLRFDHRANKTFSIVRAKMQKAPHGKDEHAARNVPID